MCNIPLRRQLEFLFPFSSFYNLSRLRVYHTHIGSCYVLEKPSVDIIFSDIATRLLCEEKHAEEITINNTAMACMMRRQIIKEHEENKRQSESQKSSVSLFFLNTLRLISVEVLFLT